MVKVSEADLFFANGLGLEDFLDDLLSGTGNADGLVIVSDDIIPLKGLVDDNEGDDGGQAHDHDPHVWFDPNNVMSWTETIADALVENDPGHAEVYFKNAADYREELRVLDNWIREQVAKIPEENRKLVTDHTVFGYFIEQYGFTQLGAVIPAITTETETSGQQLSTLIDIIRENNLKAIFIGVDFDPSLSEMIAEDTGAKLVPLYFGSLSEGAPAESYLSFMQYNVETIVNALQ
jgi:ABC-type Zn uptake system ZnuABC Zn-binding protein ZnuA